ncbi:BrnA antitoxin family protein [Pasteurellaceae bacterium 22721_9_1]
MKVINNVDYDDVENVPFTDEELGQFRPLAEVMPPDFVAMVLNNQQERAKLGKVRKPRGKQRKPTKEAVNLRLSPEVLAAFRATGKGWQTRINDVLLKHIQTTM